MNATELNVGDRVRIVSIPGEGIPGYILMPETRRVFKRLIARRRPVRIARIDEYGSPWYDCRFRNRKGRVEYHSLSIMENETNWVPVKSRQSTEEVERKARKKKRNR